MADYDRTWGTGLRKRVLKQQEQDRRRLLRGFKNALLIVAFCILAAWVCADLVMRLEVLG